MIVLTPSAGAQDFKFIPRSSETSVDLKVHDEDTNTTETYLSIPAVVDRYYLQVTVTFLPVLKEGTFYNLTVEDSKLSDPIIYKDRIFCTDQDIEDPGYSINEGQYKEHVSDNEYIVL